MIAFFKNQRFFTKMLTRPRLLSLRVLARCQGGQIAVIVDMDPRKFRKPSRSEVFYYLRGLFWCVGRQKINALEFIFV